MKRRLTFLAVGLLCSAVAGCYQKVSDNGRVAVTFETWVPWLVGIVGLALVPVGIVLFKRKQRVWGVILLIVGPVATVALAPTMFLDRVEVNQDGFRCEHGFWWNPIVHDIRYDELDRVVVVVEERSGRRGKQYHYHFDCVLKNGGTDRVPLGDLMREALPEIAEQFHEHDVEVVIPPNLAQCWSDLIEEEK